MWRTRASKARAKYLNRSHYPGEPRGRGGWQTGLPFAPHPPGEVPSNVGIGRALYQPG